MSAGGLRPTLRAHAPPHGGHLGKSLLLVALTVLYPFHVNVFGHASPRHPGGINVSLGDGVVALIAILLIFRLAAGRMPFPRYVRHASVFLIVIAAAVTWNAITAESFFYLRDSEVEAVKFFAVVTWLIAVFWLLYDEFPLRFLQFATLSVALATVLAVSTVMENLVQHVKRPSGTFDNPNLYGNYLTLQVFLALAAGRLLGEHTLGPPSLLARVLGKLRPLLRLVIAPTLLVGLLATGSRGALLGLAAGALAAVPSGTLKRLNLRRIGMLILACLVLSAALGWYLDQHPFLLKRIAKTTEGDPNVTERLGLWRAAAYAWISHPVLGIGYGQFPNYSHAVHGLRATVTHNTLLSAAAELGTVGLAAFLWLLGAAVRDGWRTRLGAGNGVARAMCGFLVATFVQGLFDNADQFRALWIGIGVIGALVVYSTRTGTTVGPARRAPEGSTPAGRAVPRRRLLGDQRVDAVG